MKSRTNIVLLGAALIVGFVAGRFTGPADPSPMPHELSSRPSSVRKESSRGNPPTISADQLQSATGARRPATAESVATTVSVAPAALADLALCTPVPLEERRVLFGGADAVAEALVMNPNERLQLEDAWRLARESVVKQQLQSLDHQQLDHALWISSKPFDGAQPRDQFLNESSRILGVERALAMWRLLKGDQAFGNWGSVPSSACSLEYIAQSDGSVVYRVTERATPDAPPGRTWISSELPTHLREVAAKLGLPIQPPQ